MSGKTSQELVSVSEQKTLAELSDTLSLDRLSYQSKLSIARQILEKLLKKFPQAIDASIFKELDRFAVCLDESFIQHRTANHLAKLAYSIYLVRKKLLRSVTLFPLQEHYDVRLVSSNLHFTFGYKQVLGILSHVHLKDKYETFDEEQILYLVQKIIPEAQVVKDSVYAFQASKNTIKTLYFEINKASGIPLSPEEIKRLMVLLKEEIRFSVEHFAPRVFMARNEEMVLKNILRLSQELRLISDMPQVMILFNQQIAQEAHFTIILVRVRKSNEPSIQEYFGKRTDLECIHDRCQIVRYLRKKYPVEANVFQIKLAKDTSLLRTDLSLNFYLARQKISQLLVEVVGNFRDYNGGIILKQREALASFREAFSEISLKTPDLLENFFYSLSPIEIQATIPQEWLKSFFQLFLEGLEIDFVKSSDYFVNFARQQEQLFVMIRIPDESFKDTVEKILSSLDVEKVATSIVNAKNTFFLGYILKTSDPDRISDEIASSLKEWKQKIDGKQILRIALEHPVVSLDPRVGGDQFSSIILKMLFEGLMRVNRDGKLQSGVAETVELSLDHKVYLFKLRRTLWSNGEAVTAFDFEYAWKKILSPTFKTPFVYLFYPIKNAKLAKSGALHPDAIGVKALDDLTLQVELEHPAPYFLELTAHTIYSPVNHLIDKKHPNWPLEDKEGYICNGAFQLKKNNPSEGYELSRNPFYWDSQNIKLEEAIILNEGSYHAYEMFQQNLNHWVGAPFGSWDSSFTPAATDEPVAFSKNEIYWCAFNNQQFPFNNKKIRQALAFAINRSELAALNNYSSAVSPLPLVHSQVSTFILSTFNADNAKALFRKALEELNISVHDFPVISFKYLAGAIRDKIAERIKHSWETTFNIRCVIEPLEWSTLFSKLIERNFQVVGVAWEAWINDPIYTLNAFRDANNPINFINWENSKYQQILYQADREIDSVKRKHFYLQAEEILLDEMPVTAIFSITSRAFKKKKLKMDLSSTLLNLKWAYFCDHEL